MRKLLLLITSLFLFGAAFSQGPQTTITLTVDAGGTTQKALLYLPFNYNPAKRYPLLVVGHGAGEAADGGTAGVGLAKLYAASTSNATARVIATGVWPDSFRVGGTGAWMQFIVVSPQSNTWGTTGPQFDFIMRSLVTTYAVDTNRMYLSGISAGGEGLVDYVIHNGVVPRWKLAMANPQSEAHDDITQVNANTIVADSVFMIGVGDSNNDIHGQFTASMIDRMNGKQPNMGVFLNNNFGHGNWIIYYTPTNKFVINGTLQNIYEYMLTKSRNQTTTPSANAGIDQTITLPTNSVTLNASSSSAGVGNSITNYLWTKLSGTAGGTITTPTAVATTVTGLVAGSNIYQVQITNNLGATSIDQVNITVNSSTAVANAGPDQSIQLPTTSVNLTGASSTGTISSYLWTQVSAPVTTTIVSTTAANTVVNGLSVAGTYTYRLSLNGGVSTDQVVITVTANSPFPACGPGRNLVQVANADTGWHVFGTAANTMFLPGDTLRFSNSPTVPRWVYISLEDFRGNPACPLVIAPGTMNVRTRVLNLGGDSTNGHNGTIELNNDYYVEICGSCNNMQYGFLVEGDPVLRYNLGSGVQLIGNSHKLRAHGIEIHNIGTGFWTKNNGGCEDSLNYPNFIMDSLEFDHNWVHGIWNEGLYGGNTSPDNAAADQPGGYDPRPIICADTTYYPTPPRVGAFWIHHNTFDSTGRGNIQLAAASGGVSLIDSNFCSHAGINGDDAQGTNISIGTYTLAYVFGNTCDSAYTWNYASLGGSSTGNPERVENNIFRNAGYGWFYNGLAETDRAEINPYTYGVTPNDLIWPQNIFVDSKPTFKPKDSTTFWIKGNVLGKSKGNVVTVPAQTIVIQNDLGTLQLHGNNIICNNFLEGTTTLGRIFIDPTATGFTFSSNCTAPPNVSAGANQNITLPVNTVTLTGVASGNNGATITGFQWSQVSGPNNPIIASPITAQTAINGMIAGTYIFRLLVTDNNAATNNAQVQVVVNPVVVTTNCNCLSFPLPTTIK